MTTQATPRHSQKFIPRRKLILIYVQVIAAVAFLFAISFYMGRESNAPKHVQETGGPFHARVDAYQPKSLCVTREGASAGTCAIPLVQDPASLHVGDRVRIQELQFEGSTNAFAVLP